ncbi:hypothetical protein JCM11672_35520 [Alkaliphilus crotonatoxidans]
MVIIETKRLWKQNKFYTQNSNEKSLLFFFRLWLNTPKGGDFTEFLIQARRFFEGIPGVRQGKVNAGWDKKAVKDALEWVFRHALINREVLT